MIGLQFDQAQEIRVAYLHSANGQLDILTIPQYMWDMDFRGLVYRTSQDSNVIVLIPWQRIVRVTQNRKPESMPKKRSDPGNPGTNIVRCPRCGTSYDARVGHSCRR